MKHISVLLQEAIDQLEIKPEGVYVDATLGAGGHSLEILKKLTTGKLIGFDVDERFHPLVGVSDHQNFEFINQNFAHLKSELENIGITQVDGILADLGWSTDQLGETEGLSFDKPHENLDMRLNSALELSAADILNSYKPDDLTTVWLQFADSPYKEAQAITKAISILRSVTAITKVGELNKLLGEIKSPRQHNLLRRVYQALRIVVNQEVVNLQDLVVNANKILGVNGRLVVITFHSLEENILQTAAGDNNLKLVGRPIRPSVAELRKNISARSAKLWTFKK